MLRLTPGLDQAVLETYSAAVDHKMEVFAGRDQVREQFDVQRAEHLTDHQPGEGEDVYFQSKLLLRPGQYGDCPMGGREHRVRCDGVVDEFLFGTVYDPSEKLRSAEQLRPLFENPEVKSALGLLRDGAEAVEIDMGTSTPWEVRKDPGQWETYRVATDPLRQEISFKPRSGRATLITRAEDHGVNREELTHEMSVSYAPRGRLVCETEMFDQSLCVH